MRWRNDAVELVRRMAESEDRHRALIDALAEGVVIRARDRSFATINPAAARLLGLTPDEVAARQIPDDAFEMLDLDGRPRPRTPELSDQVDAAGQTVHFKEIGIRRRDGSVAWAEVFAHPLRDPSTGEQIAVVATLSDRTQRRRVRAQLFALLEGVPEAVLIHERDRVLWVNQNLCTLLGYPDRAALVGRDALELVPARFHDVARARLTARAEAREVPPAEHPLRRRDGSEVMVRLRGMPILFEDRPALVTFASDLTEREQLETRLAAADRLAALGRLAASVGHEINNPLTYVMGNLELALRRVRGVDTRLAELLEEALSGAERMRQIVRDLRVFSQADRFESRAVDLRQVLGSCVRMTESEVQHRARLVEQLEAVPPIAGSEARIAQVVTNLLLNAAQAIPEERAGDAQITISARLAPDDRVELAIEDTGVGIAPEHVPHVFDPFFTTKTTTGGTGLGMSVCRMLVAAEGGEIDVASELGRGTRVTVRWPRALQAAPAPASAAAPATARARPRRRILLIDDERRVVDALRGGLAGHDVVVALGGVAGLALAEGSNPFDAIVCDLMMPELSGMELYSRLAAARPGLERRIVFVTGGAFTPRAAGFLAGVPNACLEKPFAIERLLDAIEEAIARAVPANPR
jgi:PAS domain S-box-containing protein